MVLAGVIGAICWNLVTWYFGIPSSSSHALFGGLVGATLSGIVFFGTEATVLWAGIVSKVIVPMVVSPLVGFALGAAVMITTMWVFRRGNPHKLNRGFRMAQTVIAIARR